VRLALSDLPGLVVRDTTAWVDHLVPQERQRFAHFVRRCFIEGRSKAILSRMSGPRTALSSEARHATLTLPRSWVSTLSPPWTHPWSSVRTAAASISGLVATGSGFILSWAALHARERRTG
jgi:hypothetical protein